jgi:hypothetical protein
MQQMLQHKPQHLCCKNRPVSTISRRSNKNYKSFQYLVRSAILVGKLRYAAVLPQQRLQHEFRGEK